MDKNSLAEIRRDLHRIPELGFQELKTQQYLLKYIETRIKKERYELKTWKTGIFVKLHGTEPTQMIGYRADMDGLPIAEETGLPFSSQHEGRMHACGHDFHMTIALGLLTAIAENPIKDDMLFIFQPAEESPGGALPMMKSAIMQEWKPDMIIGLHIAPEYPVGTIAVKEGLLFANTSELYIDFKGRGGHAAYPHQTNDMVVSACQFVGQLQTIVSRNVDPLDSAVVTVGKVIAGTVQNIIAEHARLEGTIRTLSPESMNKVKSRIEALAHGAEIGYGCEVHIDYGSNYYQVYNEETLTREFMDFISESDMDLYECREAMTGEDFGYMLKEIPGFMFWLGVGTEYGLHNARLNPDEEAIPKAVKLLDAYIRRKSGV
ncbi:MAG: N-acetyldiaminopimelate deacetylase [Bacillus sp. (in: firmicutes)]